MPSRALGDRLSRLPGVAECTVGDETVRLVATPGTDLRLLRARAHAVCADAGDGRALTVVPAPTSGGGPYVVRPQSALLTRVGGSKAVALGSVVALAVIAALPGEEGGQPAPLASPSSLTVPAGRQAPQPGTALGLALRLPPEDTRRRGADAPVAIPEAVPGLTVALGSPAFVQVSAPGRRADARPAPPVLAPVATTATPAVAPVAAPVETAPAPPPPVVVAPTPASPVATTTTSTAKDQDKATAKGKPKTTVTTSAAKLDPAPTVTITTVTTAPAPVKGTADVVATARVASIETEFSGKGNKGGNGKASAKA